MEDLKNNLIDLPVTNAFNCANDFNGAFEPCSIEEVNSCVTIESLAKIRAKLLHSFIFFVRVFFELRTGHKFRIGSPPGHESHYITMAKALRGVFDGNIRRLPINIPPRYGKTTMLVHFVAWAMAHYPDCNFLYVSYGKDLATHQTEEIRDIITHPIYSKIFPNVKINESSAAKDEFKTTAGGCVLSAGSGGAITGFGAGIRGCRRFGGCLIIDDLHKPNEITSDAVRDADLDWYDNTAKTRLNDGEKTPIVIIGQRLHEGDIFSKLLNQKGEEYKKNHLCLSAITPANNALCPDLHTYEQLKGQEEESSYHFWAQMMQNPQPAGGGLFKEADFLEIPIPNDIFATFITCDTAETSKTYNDATVFSFWGLHYIEQWGQKTNIIGLIWLDCNQIWVEPNELEKELQCFYQNSCKFHVKPYAIAIERKSTGTSLISFIRDIRGVRLMEIERTAKSHSKTQRFIDIQSYIGKKLVSLPKDGRHNPMCKSHMGKITANGSHLRDDIADTCYDAIKLGLIDKVILKNVESNGNMDDNEVINMYMRNFYERLQERKHLL